MSVLSFPTASRIPARPTNALNSIRRVFGFWLGEWRSRQASRAMFSLSDDMLCDIGVARSEIDEAVRHGRSR